VFNKVKKDLLHFIDNCVGNFDFEHVKRPFSNRINILNTCFFYDIISSEVIMMNGNYDNYNIADVVIALLLLILMIILMMMMMVMIMIIVAILIVLIRLSNKDLLEINYKIKILILYKLFFYDFLLTV
jgi:hypothetical protein